MRDLTVYTVQMLSQEKLFFNIQVLRKVRNITDMKELNGLSFCNNFIETSRLDKKHGVPSLAFADPYIYPRYIYSKGKRRQIQKLYILVTCRCPKFLPLIHFLSFNSAYWQFWPLPLYQDLYYSLREGDSDINQNLWPPHLFQILYRC